MGSPRPGSSVRLLIAAAAALVVAGTGTWAHPRLVAAGADPAALTAVRAVVVISAVAAIALPIAAIIRRLTR